MSQTRKLSFRSALVTTLLVAGFVMVQGPLWRPRVQAPGVTVKGPVLASVGTRELTLTAGKSVIVDSPSQLMRATVDDPQVAGTVSINPNEVLVNGITPGLTMLTLWQEDGKKRAFDLRVEAGRTRLSAARVPNQGELVLVSWDGSN